MKIPNTTDRYRLTPTDWGDQFREKMKVGCCYFLAGERRKKKKIELGRELSVITYIL